MRNDSRTSLVRKNIFFSFLIKGWSGLVQLLIVPITLFCLGNYQNGIWMTISSILIWIDSFDIGLGNGLRNKLASNLAHGELKKARENVSSTFFMLILIIVPVAILLVAFLLFFDSYSLLNVDSKIGCNLNETLILSILFVCGTFIFKFIGNVYLGLQLTAVNNALVVGGQTLALLGTYILYLLNVHSLVLIAVVNTASPLLVYLIAYPITFGIFYKNLRPSFKYFNKRAISELFNLGIRFFILQIAGVVIFASSNTLISRMFTPEFVTPYQVAYRYFSLGMLLFTIAAAPFWSATTDAFERGDFAWIKSSLRKIHLVILSISFFLLLMVLFSDFVYKLWVGPNVHVPLSLSIGSAIYMIIIMYSLSYSYILNGIGKLGLQLVFTVLAALSFIPLAWLLSRFFDLTGVITALCIINLPGMIVNRLQYEKIMRGEARGIWFR